MDSRRISLGAVRRMLPQGYSRARSTFDRAWQPTRAASAAVGRAPRRRVRPSPGDHV